MGCDFYIYVYLEIEHTNGISYYELPTIRGYYCEMDCGIYDSDDDETDRYYNSIEYKKMYKTMRRISLTPRVPVVVFNNNSFITNKFKTKYLPFIQNKLDKKYVEKYCVYEDTGTFTNIREVIKITKKEIRFEPGEGGPCLHLSNNEEKEEEEEEEESNSGHDNDE